MCLPNYRVVWLYVMRQMKVLYTGGVVVVVKMNEVCRSIILSSML